LEELQRDFPDQIRSLAADLADEKMGQEAVSLATNTFGRLDGLIINHGVLNPVKRIAEVNVDEWRQAFDINVFSAVALCKAALPELRKTGGRIVLTSSGAAVGAYSAWGPYGASKAVLNHLGMTLAVEEPDITTISIRPGTVDTDMQRELREIHHTAMDPKDAQKFAGLKGNGKLLRPDQPGNVIAKLALEGPKELSGRFLTWNDDALAKFQEG
jgi:NAD(P)-dependent dehydrogenase (short-subunit alcohol dehydrogenase family)